MMTLQQFREHVLTGKTVEELYSLIEDFKIEKVFLKVGIEQKNIVSFTLPPETMMTKINNYRLYIQETYDQIEKMGGTSNRTADEAFALKFQENLENIDQIDYQIGGYFEGYEDYKMQFEDNKAVFTKDDGSPKQVVMDKDTCLNDLRELYMGEWRELYQADDYGQDISDGTSWSVAIYYKNGMETVGFEGNNAFPYNFGHFNNLITGGLI